MNGRERVKEEGWRERERKRKMLEWEKLPIKQFFVFTDV
jgi:hypothetical protein